MESENVAAARLRVQQVGEARFRPGGLVEERQRLAVRRKYLRQPVAVLARLGLHTGERVAGGFRLHDAGRLAIDVQQVIGGPMAGLQPELPDCHAAGR